MRNLIGSLPCPYCSESVQFFSSERLCPSCGRQYKDNTLTILLVCFVLWALVLGPVLLLMLDAYGYFLVLALDLLCGALLTICCLKVFGRIEPDDTVDAGKG